MVLFILDDLCYAPLLLSNRSDEEQRPQQQEPRSTLELMQLIASEAPACVRFLLTSKLDTRVLYENGLSPEHVEVITLERSRATQQLVPHASANVYTQCVCSTETTTKSSRQQQHQLCSE